MCMTKIKIIFTCGLVLLTMFFSFNNQAKAENVYDLKADSLTMNSAKCEVNQICIFTATVKNLGGDFSLNFPLKSTVSGDGYAADSPTAVSPAQGAVIKTGDDITFIIYGAFSKIGSIALTFAVDMAGYLAESDGSNNSVGLTVNIIGYDLAAESITVQPASPTVNQNCYIRVAVKNNSSYNLYAETGLNLTRVFPDFTITNSSSTAPSLAHVISPGGYIYYNYEGKFTAAGEKTLTFTVDPDDVLKESNLANNLATVKINAYNADETDLAIDSIVFSAAKIILGQPFDLIVGIKNTGKTLLTDAVGLSKAEFSFNLPNFDYGINDLTVDAYPSFGAPLNPAEVFHYTFHGAFNQPGNFNLSFIINKDKLLTEANYDNDASSTLVTVYKSLAEADDFNIISKSVSLISSTTAIISWKTNLNTTGVLNYNLAHNNVSDNRIDVTDNLTAHAVTLNNLRQGENYIFMITAKNGTAEKLDMLNNFLMPADDVLRITAGPSVSVLNKNATFSWTTNLTSSDRVYYKKKDATDTLATGADTAVAEHKVEIKDLAPGVYDYFLSSTSTLGASARSASANFEIKIAPVTPTSPSAPTATSPAAPALDNTAAAIAAASFPAISGGLYEKLKGKIILQVESYGEAYYISPKDKKIYYLGRPADAFQVIRNQGLGITSANLAKIPVGLSALSGTDTDGDGLPDALETAIGTDKNKADTDGDGFNDKSELINGYSPMAKNLKLSYDQSLVNKQKGKILLQVENRGEAWYVNPADGQRYFLAKAEDAFNLMRKLGVGVSNSNYQALGGK